MSLESLPDDILRDIMLYVDNTTLLLTCVISHIFHNFSIRNMYSLLSENLRRTSRLNLKGYNMKQLVQLNKISFANKNINAGLRHSLILTINGEIYGCGYNEFGQLGLGNYSNRNTPILLSNNITQISVGGQHSIILTDNKQIYSFGS